MVKTMTLRSRYDDLDISVLVVSPEGQTHAVIQFSHGMCGCKERYLPVMEYMAEKGVACVAGDHRGHGASIKSEKSYTTLVIPVGVISKELNDSRKVGITTVSIKITIPTVITSKLMG